MKKILLLALAAFNFSCQKSTENYKILVGTYTDKGSDGIYYVTLDEKMQDIKMVSHTNQVKNPSFLTYNNGIIYTVNELDPGSAQAIRFDPISGTFSPINTQDVGGAHPCHISISGSNVVVGNYSGGNVAVLPIQKDGSLGEVKQLFQNTGSGPLTDRQEKPHIHSVNPYGNEIWVADLGTDEILIYETKGDTLSERKRIKFTAGAGPRHITFHPTLKVAYIINELNNTVTSISTETYAILQEISTLPEGFVGKSHTADIHLSPDGKFLYGSNRFSESLARFSVDGPNGELTFQEVTDVKGKMPRNFAISPDGKYILVANQETDNIVVFKRDIKTGKIESTGTEIKISKPVCIKFI